MSMSLEEIKAKSKHMYEHVDDINTMSEAKQAVRDACSMVFYLTDHVMELAKLEAAEKAEKTKASKT